MSATNGQGKVAFKKEENTVAASSNPDIDTVKSHDSPENYLETPEERVCTLANIDNSKTVTDNSNKVKPAEKLIREGAGDDKACLDECINELQNQIDNIEHVTSSDTLNTEMNLDREEESSSANKRQSSPLNIVLSSIDTPRKEDADGYCSDIQEDEMVLKWDDDDEEMDEPIDQKDTKTDANEENTKILSKGIKPQFDDNCDEMDVDATSVTVASIIANLDQVIEEHKTEQNKTTVEIQDEVECTPEVAIDTNKDTEQQSKNLDNDERDTTNLDNKLFKANVNEPTMDLDISSVQDSTNNDDKLVTSNENNPKTVNKDHINTLDHESSFDDSINDVREHGLNKPDMMIEIPTQELIDIEDDSIHNISTDIASVDNITETSMTAVDEIEKEKLEKVNVEIEYEKNLQPLSKAKTIENVKAENRGSADKLDSVLARDTKIAKPIETTDKLVDSSVANSDKLITDYYRQINTSIIAKETKISTEDEMAPINADTLPTNVEREELSTSEYLKTDSQNEQPFKDDAQPSTSYITQNVQPTTSYMPQNVQPSTSYMPQNGQPSTSYMPQNVQPSTSYMPQNGQPSTSYMPQNGQPSTSYMPQNGQPSTSYMPQNGQPSTSYMTEMAPDTSDEMPEMSDSLGLLSAREIEDVEEQETSEHDDGDDDDDFDADVDDDGSNLMTAEHSEDSNAQHSESDQAKEHADIQTDTEDTHYCIERSDAGVIEESEVNNQNFLEKDVESSDCVLEKDREVDNELGFTITSVVSQTIEADIDGDNHMDVQEKNLFDNEFEATDVVFHVDEIRTTALDEIKMEPEEDAQEKTTEFEATDAVSQFDQITQATAALDEIKMELDEDAREKTTEFEATDAVSQFDQITQATAALDEIKMEPGEDGQEKATEFEATAALDDIKMEPGEDAQEKTPEQPSKPTQHTSDVETVRLSDTSDNETDGAVDKANAEETIILRSLLQKSNQNAETEGDNQEKQSPSKGKLLEISQPKHVVNIVDLGGSSEDEEAQEAEKRPAVAKEGVTSVNLPDGIEIMSSGGTGHSSEIVTKEGEIVISGVPKPRPHKPARLNTGEVTIKTAKSDESTLVIPETKINDQSISKPKFSLEVFSLDSDDEDTIPAKDPSPKRTQKKTWNNKCINNMCKSHSTVPYLRADASTVSYYDANKKKKAIVCEPCAYAVALRAQKLVEGIKEFTPLLDMDMGKVALELVEISDSDSEDEGDIEDEPTETIGVLGAMVVEEELASMLNGTWIKYKMDERLRETQDSIFAEIDRLEKASAEVTEILDKCQVDTDKLRNDLYSTFERKYEELPPVFISDTPENMFSCPETNKTENLRKETEVETPHMKRRLSISCEPPAKRPAIPLGYTPLDNEVVQPQAQPTSTDAAASAPAEESQPPLDTPEVGTAASNLPAIDDDKDVSVVTLSAEAAPPDLPPPGEIVREPLRVGMNVYAMRNAFGAWLVAKVMEITAKGSAPPALHFSLCRVKFENKTTKNQCKVLPARCLAYAEPSAVRMTIGTRVIALFKDAVNLIKRESYYSGVVAEIPNPVNNYRYLVFFDDGYAQYVQHAHTRLVCEFSSLVWEEVHPFSREFVRQYLLAYPERPMVRLHTGQSIKTEWNGKWWVSKVIQVDASLVQVHFEEDDRTEWIYRGSTRLAPLYLELQAAERHRARPLPRNRVHARVNMPYVEYTRSEESAAGAARAAVDTQAMQQEEIRRQRSVAKKSTAAPVPPPPPAAPPTQHVAGSEMVTSRVVYYTPKNSVKPYKMSTHQCGPHCKRKDVLALKDLRTYNPLAKPLLSGWERQIVRFKGLKQVMYRTPCGRRVRNMRELHRYLRLVQSDMGVDLFDFGPTTHCLAEFMLNKCLVGKKDLSHGKENVPVPCVNYYDESLPEFCSYNTERTPTAGVPLNLDPEFLCGCDCTDDCQNKSKCACWKMTLEGARTIGLDGRNYGYVYRRLPEPLPSGIYECNSRCKCKSTCLNRVAQHPLQLKLQVFKTLNRGWGIRALNDVPKGSFLCVYAGNLLTDATANLDGLNEGDEYLAELDYIEVVEQMKEGYEDDIPDADKKLDKDGGNSKSDDDDDDDESSSEDETKTTDKEDTDFLPGFIGPGLTQFSKRLRKREKAKKDKADEANSEKNKDSGKENAEDDCITISDDEEVREPSRFTAQAGMGGNEFISKYRSVRTLYGKDEACYIMDAKVQGNIGRYLNHSCCPNVFVQNVFVDTHDPRFPWVAFFALSHIRAGTELTWNYNYDIGSVPGKTLYCHCGAPNCRGRLL